MIPKSPQSIWIHHSLNCQISCGEFILATTGLTLTRNVHLFLCESTKWPSFQFKTSNFPQNPSISRLIPSTSQTRTISSQAKVTNKNFPYFNKIFPTLPLHLAPPGYCYCQDKINPATRPTVNTGQRSVKLGRRGQTVRVWKVKLLIEFASLNLEIGHLVSRLGQFQQWPTFAPSWPDPRRKRGLSTNSLVEMALPKKNETCHFMPAQTDRSSWFEKLESNRRETLFQISQNNGQFKTKFVKLYFCNEPQMSVTALKSFDVCYHARPTDGAIWIQHLRDIFQGFMSICL